MKKIFLVMIVLLGLLQTCNADEVPWRESPKSQKEKQLLWQALCQSPEFINNYTFEGVECINKLNYVGRGREGIVYLARKINSYQLMALKVQCDGRDPLHGYNGQEEVENVKLFDKATGYSFEARNHPSVGNGVSFNAKTFITGESLQDMMQSNRLFNGELKYDYICDKLAELLDCLISQGLFFADTAPDNFVFDGTMFYLIDFRPMEYYAQGDWKSDPLAYTPFTRKKYYKQILNSEEEMAWIQNCYYHQDCSLKMRAAFKDFLQKMLTL